MWATPNTMDHLPPRSKEGTIKLMTGQRKGRTRPSNLREQVDPETMRLWRTPDANCMRGPSFGEKNEDEIRKENANKFERSSGESTFDVANTKSEQSDTDDNRQESREVSEQKQIESRGGRSWTLREASWSSEPDVGRVANGIPGRAYRLRGLGNAVVPKIPEEIGKAIWKVLNQN